MRVEFIRTQSANYRIRTLCKVMDVSTSGYYAWRKRPVSTRRKDDDNLSIEVRAIHKVSRGRYGSPRVHRVLRKKRVVSRKRVARLMREEGLAGRPAARFLIFHSDRGSQYTSAAYQALLASVGAVSSMSRKGNCWDNAVSESFFATLKKELIYRYDWLSRDDAAAAVAEYIEVFYNNQRLHSSIGYTTPAEFEVNNSTPQPAQRAA